MKENFYLEREIEEDEWEDVRDYLLPPLEEYDCVVHRVYCTDDCPNIQECMEYDMFFSD